MTRGIAQSCSVILVDILGNAVLVHRLGPGGIGGACPGGKKIRKVLNLHIRRSLGTDYRRGGRALGAGVDILADPADGLRRQKDAPGLHAAVQLRHSGVVQNGKTHCRAGASLASHGLRVGNERADSLGVRGNNHIT